MNAARVLAPTHLKVARVHANSNYSGTLDGVTGQHVFAAKVIEVDASIVAEFSESLTQGSTGHNTDCTHFKPRGGGYLPLIQGSSQYILHTDTVVFRNETTVQETRTYVKYTYFYTARQRRSDDSWYFIEYQESDTVYKDPTRPSIHAFFGNCYIYDHYIYGPSSFTFEVRKANLQGDYTEGVLITAAENAKRSRSSTQSYYNLNGTPGKPDFTHYDLEDRPWIERHYGLYPYNVQNLRCAAFLDACEELPRLCDNGIANAIECIEMLLGAFDPEEVITSILDTVSSVRSLWMWWRYAFTTTRLDTYQALDYQFRTRLSCIAYHRFDGFATEEILAHHTSNPVQCHCGFKVRIDPARLLSNIGWQRGLELNEYVLWDCIPLSFVADWFLNVGDRAEFTSNLRHYLSDYEFADMFYTTVYDATVETQTQVHANTYTREYSGPPSILRGGYYPSSRDASVATLIKRGVDVLALVQV